MNSRISTLENELHNVNSGISSTNNSIYYEERRIAQEEETNELASISSHANDFLK